VFAGNPAAVCPLDGWLADPLLQAIATENNLSETAFFIGRGGQYDLRWFTPTTEVDLCGHATLASAYVIFNYLERDQPRASFQTRSGELTVKREDDLLVMDFPAHRAAPCEAPAELLRGLGQPPREILLARESPGQMNYLAVYESEAEVRALQPDIALLGKLERTGVIVSAPGRTADFVSRYFAPSFGVPEDPVTGSTHCTLTPYWAARLGKTQLRAEQVSARGGELLCRDQTDRVVIAGRAARYLEGRIYVSPEAA
jgi:PhzF family phenazine biosynthesis protein